MALKTGFVKVAQSGKTIDGREIKPEWLLDAAETYSKDVYTAQVFPNHWDWASSYGIVDALKAEKDKNGVVSLYADISPNAFWQSDLRYGQNMFTSVSLIPDFAGTGKWYMESLAATNNPASLGVEKLEFSKSKKPTALFTQSFDTAQSNNEFSSDEKSLFAKFLNFMKGDADAMASKEFTELKTQLDGLSEQFKKLADVVAGGAEDKPDESAKFSALEKENGELKAKVADLEKTNTEFSTQFKELKTAHDALVAKVEEAMKDDSPKPKPRQEFSSGGGTEEDLSVFA